MTDHRRVAVAARVFTLTAIASTALLGNVALAGVWWAAGIAVIAELSQLGARIPVRWVVVVEAVATAVIGVIAFPAHEAALPYLALPALIAGITTGARWVGVVVLVEAASLGTTWAVALGHDSNALSGDVATWLITGVGLGLLGTLTRRAGAGPASDASYRSALELIRQLHALSGRLTSGLDPVDIADEAIAAVGEDIVVRSAVVVVRQAGEFTALRHSPGVVSYPLDEAEQLLYRAWNSREPVLGGSRVVLPILADSDPVALLLLDCLTMPDERTVDRVTAALAPAGVRLNAALLFTAVRDSATSEERHRLAREVHDGVAQDVASLGYLVDNLAATTVDPEQAHAVAILRREVTRVVAELRNSVFDLRNETAVGQGLGQSIASFARHIGSHSELTVHVTLDESAVRLGPRVEAELLRITQEAINNARRHSGGRNLWVSCRVHPPYAEIGVLDDGEGIRAPRDDSHGLRIMHERADRVGADLTITSPADEGRGTRITLQLT
ncbi:MAG: two-component sensor histidine kinase [Marmoricola sp.]|nr:two-component sensor histidine kinase [Marmoricola sp.]